MIGTAGQRSGAAARGTQHMLRLSALSATALAAAPAAAQQALAHEPTLGTGIPGLNYTALQGKGAIVGAAEYQAWTVLRVAPDETPAEKQPAQ